MKRKEMRFWTEQKSAEEYEKTGVNTIEGGALRRLACKGEYWGCSGQPSRLLKEVIPVNYGTGIGDSNVKSLVLIYRPQTEVCATRSRGELWRLKSEDHDSRYQMDMVTATGLWDGIGACPNFGHRRANAFG